MDPRHIGSTAWKANRSDMKPPLASQTAVKPNDTALWRCTGDITSAKQVIAANISGLHGDMRAAAALEEHCSHFLSHLFCLSRASESSSGAADVCTASSRAWIGSRFLLPSNFLEIFHRSAFYIILWCFSHVIFLFLKDCRSRKKISLNKTSFVYVVKGKHINTQFNTVFFFSFF